MGKVESKETAAEKVKDVMIDKGYDAVELGHTKPKYSSSLF